MKRYVFAILTCALLSFAYQETTEGIITYSSKINMHKRIPAEQESIKQMIPEFTISRSMLLFNPAESLYKPVPADENPFDQPSGQGRVMIRNTNENETYLDRMEAQVTQLIEFMGKKYLIKKEQTDIPWKLENNIREIQGYACKSAFFIDENKREIRAWYTEAIRQPLGPEGFHGLPGLILEVTINDDEIVISAEKLELRALKKNELKVPKGGQEVSEEEYQAMVEEQMKNLGMQPQGQGGFRMIIRN
jgi:GLPGLI family protein